ncbi:MAG TPA: hypothetical protein VGN97_06160 [Mesorhizobium sp.]|nr:hypothetical protein [Mesorhizobium sp.]
MDSETVTEEKVAAQPNASVPERERSTIQFPYMDLGDAAELVQTLHQNVGRGEATEDQLAAWLNLSAKSSGFRVRIATTKMFDLIESNSEGLRLTELGHSLMDPAQERRAKVKAFLAVPLYKVVYENYKGGVVPPAAAFERDIRKWGVAEKQTSRARQAFERSAEFAGFYESGRNRLVVPASASFKDAEDSSPPDHQKDNDGAASGGAAGSRLGGGGGGGLPPHLDPIIKGLIDRLPRPGTKWDKAKRKLWLQILENSFDLVYEDDAAPPPDNAFG